jgi:hypothetical protein
MVWSVSHPYSAAVNDFFSRARPLARLDAVHPEREQGAETGALATP